MQQIQPASNHDKRAKLGMLALIGAPKVAMATPRTPYGSFCLYSRR